MSEAGPGSGAVPGRRDALRVTYLLADTAMSGGAKVAIQQANLLSSRGHIVTVASPGEAPGWISVRGRFRRLDSLDRPGVEDEDVVVATFWTTLEPAADAAPGRVLHYCQGFEWSFTHNTALHDEIRRAYALPIPAMAVTPWLAATLGTEFGRRAVVVPPPLDATWRPAARLGRHGTARVVVMQPYEIDWKGVATALDAVAALRAAGQRIRVVRISQWPAPSEERDHLEADEFHVHVPPATVARLLRRADLLLAPSWPQEGFGLHVLEAMASGLPVVATDIPAFRFSTAGAAPLVPVGDAAALAAAAAEVLDRPKEWRRRRHAGLASARRFDEGTVAEAAEAAVAAVAAGRSPEPVSAGPWGGGGEHAD